MRKLVTLLAMVAVSGAYGQAAEPDTRSATSSSRSETAAYGNNITFNSSAPETQRLETVSRNEGRQEIVNSGETHQYVEYGGTHKIKSASQAYAPPVGVTAPCIIGASVGIAGMGWGFSGGSGHKDEGCERRAASALMHSYGHVEAAKEVLCVDPMVAAAYARAGIPCKAVQLSQAAVPVSSPTGQSVMTPACYADAKIAARAKVPVCQPQQSGTSSSDPSAAP